MSIINGYNPMCRIGLKDPTPLDKKLSSDIPSLTPLKAKWYMIYYNSHRKTKDEALFEDYPYNEQLDKMTELIKDIAAQEYISSKEKELGFSSKSRSYLTRIFTSNISAQYRQEVIEDVAAMFSNTVENLLRDSHNKGKSRIDVIKGNVDTIFEKVKNAYTKHYNNIINDLVGEGIITEEVLDKIKNGELDTDSFINSAIDSCLNTAHIPVVRDRIKKLQSLKCLGKILGTPGVWAATIMLSKAKLLDYERVKLGYASEFATLVDNLDDYNNEEASGDNEESAYDEIMDAENTTLEHWMEKADTRSAASGVSAEVRGFFNSILIKDDLVPRTILGSLHRGDMHEMFNQMLSIMESGFKDSDEMWKALTSIRSDVRQYIDDADRDSESATFRNEDYEGYIHSGLYTMIGVLKNYKKNDLEKYYHLKTLIFNNFNKALIDYTTLDTRGNNFSIKYNDEDNKNTLVTFTNAVRSDITIDPSIREGVYADNGMLDESKAARLGRDITSELALIKANISNPEVLTQEHKYSQITSFLTRLNLVSVVNIDTNTIYNDSKESNEAYLSLIESLQSFLNGLGSTGNILHLQSSSYNKAMQTIEKLVSSKLVSAVDKRETHFEGSLHFGQSTYFNRTEYFSMAQKYSEIRSYIELGDKTGLQAYLKNNYLRNPLFNSSIDIENDTMNVDASFITHDWLKQLWYWATMNNDELAKTPDYNSSFIDELKHPIVRGLGYQDGYVEFRQFDLSQNYKFTIAHLMETYIRTKGKCILVPTLVLGDADSIRFVPSTTIDFGYNNHWRQKFLNILKQDIADQRNFINMADYLISSNTANTDGKLNSSYFNKDGSVKCCINYFPELRQRYESSLRNYLSNRKSDESIYECSKRCTVDFINSIDKDLSDANLSEEMLYDKYLKPSLDSEVSEFKKALMSEGLAEKVPTGNGTGVVTFATGNSSQSIFPTVSEGNDKYNKYDKAFSDYEANPELDSLSIMYLQYKYGIIQHIQFSGISPSFYGSFEDMQKRWKEQVAPGRTLDFAARDRDGKPVFTVGAGGYAYEKVAYFDDLKVNPWNDNDWATLVEESGASEATMNIYGKHGAKSSVTDGESYRSLDSYRQIMIGAGEWQKDSRNETVYQIIKRVRSEHEAYLAGSTKPEGTTNEDWEAHKEGRLSKSEWRIIIDSKVCWQPLKPFMYTHEKITMEDGTVLDNPTQLKYAEVPLIPELLPKDSKLGMLGKAMDSNHVDLLASTKCVKVGAWDSINISNMESMSQEELNKAFLRTDNNGNILTDPDTNEPLVRSHLLSLQGYLLQNNIPDHMNTFRGEGTQVRKILGYTGTTEMMRADGTPLSEICNTLVKYGHIKIGDDMTIDTTKPLTGEEMQHLFTALESAGWVQSAKDFRDTINDPVELNKIIENTISNSATSADDQYQSLSFENEDIIDNNGKHTDLVRTIPLSEGLFSADIMANLLSILRKRVVKQQTNGGTAVQVAPTGMNLKVHYHYATANDVKTLKEKNPNSKVQIGHPCNIEWVESAMTFDFKVTNTRNEEVELDYLTYVDPETGCLLRTVRDGSGKIVTDNEGNPKKEVINMNAKDLNKELESSDLCRDYPGIIDSIVYRVPTERAYSSIAVKAVRFFPKTNGTIIAVPAHWTTVAGFDYDIDKLYFIRRQYVEGQYRVGETTKVSLTEDELWSIWTEIYDIHKDLYKALVESYMETHPQATEDNINLWEHHINGEWKNAIHSRNPEIRNVVRGYNKNRLFNEVKDRMIKEGQLKGIERRLNYADKDTPLIDQPNYCINNLKFDYMWARWSSPSTLLERITPGGFYNIEHSTPLMKMITRNQLNDKDGNPIFNSLAEARKYAESYSDSYEDASDFETVQGYQTSNVVYGALIGMAATQNILQKLLSMVPKCKLVEYVKDPVTKELKPQESSILFGSMVKRHKTDPNVGCDLVTKYKGGKDSELILAELLASAVDAVKEGTLEYYNIRTNLFNIVALSARLGAMPEDIGLLLNQPIVKEAINLMSNGTCHTFKTAMKMAFKAMSGTDYTSPKEDSTPIDENALFMNIVDYKGGYKNKTAPVKQNVEVYERQRKVMDTIIRLTDAASEFGNLARSARATSGNGTGSRISSLEYLLMSTDKTSSEFGRPETGSKFYVNGGEGIDNKEQKLLDLDLEMFDAHGDIKPDILERLSTMPLGIENCVLIIMKDFVNNVCHSEFPYMSQGYRHVKNSFARLGSKFNPLSGDIDPVTGKPEGKGVLSDEMLNLINTELPTYLFGRYAKVHENDESLDDEAKDILSMFSSGMLEVPTEKVGSEDIHNTYNLLRSKRDIFLDDFMNTLYNDLYRGTKREEDHTKKEQDRKDDLNFYNRLRKAQRRDLQKSSIKEDVDRSVTAMLRTYDIMNMITIKENRDKNKYIIFSAIGKMDSGAKNRAIDSWSQMLADSAMLRNSKDSVKRLVGQRVFRIALGLMAYDFQTKGLGVFSRSTANSLTPSDVKLNIPGYITFNRMLPNLRVDADGNFMLLNPNTGVEENLGTEREFMELLVINQVSKNSNNVPIVYDYIHTLYDNEQKALLKDPEIRNILDNKDKAINGVLGTGSNDIVVTIEDPANSVLNLWNGTLLVPSGNGNSITMRKMYPFIRIDDRIYEAVTDPNGYIPQTEVDGKQVLTVRYRLFIGSVSRSSRTDTFSTDFSDYSNVDKAVTSRGVYYTGEVSSAINDVSDSDIELTYWDNPLSMSSFEEKSMAARLSNDLGLPQDFLTNMKESGDAEQVSLYNSIMTIAIIGAQEGDTTNEGYYGNHIIDERVHEIIGNYLKMSNGKLVFKEGYNLDKMRQEAQDIADKQNLCVEVK